MKTEIEILGLLSHHRALDKSNAWSDVKHEITLILEEHFFLTEKTERQQTLLRFCFT